MSIPIRHHAPGALRQGGFTLVELMVTVAIALFLLGGLMTIMQNVRQANLTQSSLNSMLDQERFALTVMTDAIQVGGYVANPLGDATSQMPATGGFTQGAAFYGLHSPLGVVPDSTATDTIYIRFHTQPAGTGPGGTGPILCNGYDTSTEAVATNYTIAFTILGGALQCSVDGGNTWEPIVPGVSAMAIYYGVNRSAPGADYNIDTYVTGDNMVSPNDWLTVSSVRIVLSFKNTVVGPNQPAVVTVERVVQVMGRAGVVT
jgi:prepilin-type N-terminal cleavage/methylation domain-containing protein